MLQISVYAQGNLWDQYSYSSSNGAVYWVNTFSRQGNRIKAKYFATNARYQYESWSIGKNVLLIAAGAFYDNWKMPVGLCVDNGKIVNRTPVNDMDGFVIIYNGGEQQGGVAVTDLRKNCVKYQSGNDSHYFCPRNGGSTFDFLNWGEKEGLTLFQTQLVYSIDNGGLFGDFSYGSKRERRFLATCKKNGYIHHSIINTTSELTLSTSAYYAKKALEYHGYDVMFILNLDVGDQDVFYVKSGNSLVKYGGKDISASNNMIVYYYE